MPYFSTRPSTSLTGSLRSLIGGSGGINPLQEIAIEQAAARTVHQNALTTKLLEQAESERSARAARSDPALAAEFASHSAGIDIPTGNRLADHLRGKLEQPGPADIDDANMAGLEAKPYVTGAPNVDGGQRRTFQSALAAILANRLGTGKTNADQLTKAAGNVADGQLTEEAVRAGEAGDLPRQNRLVSAAAGRAYTPFRTNSSGTVIDTGSGDLDEAGQLAGTVRNRVAAAAQASRAAAGASSARRDFIAGPQTDLANARAKLVKDGKPPTPVAPERVERMIDMSSHSEYKAEKAAWDALPYAQRQKTPAPTLAAVRERVAARYQGSGQEIADAEAAIAAGADEKAVRARFKQRRGFELPRTNKVAAAAADPDDDDPEE